MDFNIVIQPHFVLDDMDTPGIAIIGQIRVAMTTTPVVVQTSNLQPKN